MTSPVAGFQALGRELAAYPDPLAVAVILFGDIARTGAHTPTGWDGTTPFLLVRLFGGSDNGWTDRPRFDVDSLAPNEITADANAEKVRQRALAGPFRVTLADGTVCVVDRIDVDTRPHHVPWGSTLTVFNSTATYSMSVRRPTGVTAT